MSTTKHTPTPWFKGSDINDGHNIYQDDGHGFSERMIGSLHQEDDAAFIVEACNAHDDFIAALEAIAKKTVYPWASDVAKAVLAKHKAGA